MLHCVWEIQGVWNKKKKKNNREANAFSPLNNGFSENVREHKLTGGYFNVLLTSFGYVRLVTLLFSRSLTMS